MRSWTREGRAHYPLEAALRRTHWLDARWSDDAHDFAATFLDALIDAARTQEPKKAVVTAYGQALRKVPLEAVEAHRRARLTLVHGVREILAEAARNLTGSSDLCDELTRVAASLSAAIPSIPGSGRTASSRASTEPPLSSRGRVASDELRRSSTFFPADPAAAVFLRPSRTQLALSLETLVSADEIAGQAQAAVLSSLNAVRGEARWIEAPGWVKRALVRDALASASASLASSALEDGQGSDPAIDAAVALLATLDRVDTWIPDRGMRGAVPGHPGQTGQKAQAGQPGQRTPLRNEARKMSDTKNPVLQTIQDDASDAAWRLAGSQFLKAAREPLVGLLQRHLGPDDAALRAKIATFLETPVGAAVLGSLLSVGLAALPPAMGPHPARLSRELRVKAMTDAGELVADVLMGPLRQVIATYLQGVPVTPEPQVIAAPTVRNEMGQGTPPTGVPAATESATVTKQDTSG